eukprot:EG_transcript_22968
MAGIMLIPATATHIVGVGTTMPSHVYRLSPFAYSFAQPNTQVTYYASEADEGLCRLTSSGNACPSGDSTLPNNVDFAASTITLSQAYYAKYPDLQMYPTLAAAICPIYNLPGTQDLVLSTTALAQIFSGQIRTWDDPRIQATNANFSLWNVPAGQPIEVVVRQEDSDVTAVFKRALAMLWSNFSTLANESSTISWGNLTSTVKEGTEGVNTYVLRTPWTISYSIHDDASDFNIPQARLLKAGNVVVEASDTSTLYAMLEMGLSFGNNGEDP